MCCALWFALRRHCLIWSSESKELGAIFIPDFTEDESAAQVGKVTEVTQLASVQLDSVCLSCIHDMKGPVL